MKILLVNGSPRKKGNTSALVDEFIKKMNGKADIDTVTIFDKKISGCSNCQACQKAILKEHCAIKDDMSPLYQKFLDSDTIIFASPIYMWQFTPCTLAFLNRLHCLCQSAEFKYNDMKGKKMAVMMTMADEEEVAEFAVEGLIEFCKFFSVDYLGDLRIPFAERQDITAGKYDGEIGTFTGRLA